MRTQDEILKFNNPCIDVVPVSDLRLFEKYLLRESIIHSCDVTHEHFLAGQHYFPLPLLGVDIFDRVLEKQVEFGQPVSSGATQQ